MKFQKVAGKLDESILEKERLKDLNFFKKMRSMSFKNACNTRIRQYFEKAQNTKLTRRSNRLLGGVQGARPNLHLPKKHDETISPTAQPYNKWSYLEIA